MNSVSERGRNQLLAALPPAYVASLHQRFETVELRLLDVLARPDEELRAVLFPLRGMISIVQTVEGGASVEVGLVGTEGFLGVPLLLGARSSPAEAMVQGDGAALRIPATAFLAELQNAPELRARLLRYVHTLLAQVMQTAACNASHAVPQRLARWLLEAQDRLDRAELPLSHELLSFMLGCRRAGVTVALGALRASGVVDAGRGAVRVTDRAQLESTACACYQTVRDETERVLPGSRRAGRSSVRGGPSQSDGRQNKPRR